MQIATDGLVLRQVKVGEADQILTILTPDHGVLSASARGSLRLKSKLFSACGLFCYSEFTITAGRASYFVDTAAVKRSFMALAAAWRLWPLQAIWLKRPVFWPRSRRSQPSFCACCSTACT